MPDKEPQPAIGKKVPDCPAYLKGVARVEWKRIAPELHRMGLLTVIDHSELESYCYYHGLAVESAKELARMKKTYRSLVKLRKKDPSVRLGSNGMVAFTSNGNTIMEPMLSVLKQAVEMKHRLLMEFGMTPASRSRLSGGDIGKREKSKSAMQRLLEAQKDMSN